MQKSPSVFARLSLLAGAWLGLQLAFCGASDTPPPSGPAAKASLLPVPDPARIREIASFLDEQPRGTGPSLDDRKAWDELARDADLKSKTLKRAEGFLNEPTPEVSEALWMQSIRSRDRKADGLIDKRRFRLATWVLAEGMENQGRFLPAIEKEIGVICSEPTWVAPSLDSRAQGFQSPEQLLDLGAAMVSWTLVTADSMLGDRLSATTRQQIRDRVRERIILPYLEKTRGQGKPEWWRIDNYNWNAVVHGGVVGVALAVDPSREERAEVIASVEKELPYYLQGFPSDGYSWEGMGYWKYGFGHYVMLSEAILRATQGKVNLYAGESARLVAQFPRRFELVPKVYPAFADSQFMEEPSLWLYHIIDHRYGLGDAAPRVCKVDSIFSTFLYAYGTAMTFDSSAAPVFTEGGAVDRGHKLRDWFERGQVYIGRLPEGAAGLTLGLKGGNNGTRHGHCDLGSYVVAMQGQPLIVDPGATQYTGATFSAERYQNQIIGSYGHSVPKVAGDVQREGWPGRAIVTGTSFADDADVITLDISRGYQVAELRGLLRRFDYSRAGQGSVTVTDQVEFETPQAFGTAMATYGEAREEQPGVWIISQKGEAVRVEITADAPLTVTNETLKDESRAGKVRRLGIDLNAPSAKATIAVKITPAAKL